MAGVGEVEPPSGHLGTITAMATTKQLTSEPAAAGCFTKIILLKTKNSFINP